MSSKDKRIKHAETLAWITDDEAEFWTSVSPKRKDRKFDEFTKSNEPISNDISSDGLYFKTDNELDKKVEDHLSLLYHQGIEHEAKQIEENAEKKPISEIFEFDKNVDLNENIPGISMSFLDRLFHQLTRPSARELDDLSDEEFTEIDESELTAVNNNNNSTEDINTSLNNKNGDLSILDTVRSFIDELNEETNVLRGTVDYETLFNRRSHKAKSLQPTIANNHILVSETSFDAYF